MKSIELKDIIMKRKRSRKNNGQIHTVSEHKRPLFMHTSKQNHPNENLSEPQSLLDFRKLSLQ